MKSDIEVIDDAIALVERDGGWCQDAYCRTPDGRSWSVMDTLQLHAPTSFCLEGAIAYVNGYMTLPRDSNNWARVILPLGKQLRRLNILIAIRGIPEDHSTYGHAIEPREFNDDKTTTQEDAILALKRTRNYLEQQERFNAPTDQ